MAHDTTQTTWLASLSPWPVDGFGLDRMRALLARLGDPQQRYPAIHVVGTNGKTTATRTLEAILLEAGLSVGSTVSPHVRSWSERITIDGRDADLEVALARVRSAAEDLGATQFETITAAALTAFAAAEVDAAVVEAGLGGRHDATNVLRTRVVLLTSVGLDHTDVLGATLEAIATEKLAVAGPGTIVVLPDERWTPFTPPATQILVGGAREAAEAFLGHRVDRVPTVAVPGRLEHRPGEIRDGAHNPDGVRWLVERLRPGRFTLCVSVPADKDGAAMLAGLAALGDRFVATTSSNARALAAADLARHARGSFAHVEVEPDPARALARAHALGEPVLVTGSLYLLADLAAAERASRSDGDGDDR
jgi:dihydrofolate synthase/folylpolyglutamate synthase